MSGTTVAAIIIALIITLIVTLVVLRRVHLEKKRAELVRKWAEQSGWSYTASDPDLAYELTGVHLEKGRGNKALNVCARAGAYGQAIFVDFRYVTVKKISTEDGRTTSTKTRPYTILAVKLSGGFPSISVVPHTAKTRTLGRFASDRIITGDARFDKTFSVISRSPEQGGLVLTPTVIEYCLNNPNCSWALTGRWLSTWVPGGVQPTDIRSHVSFVEGLAARLPRTSG